MGYTGKLPVPRNWDEARRIVIDVYKRQFVAMDEAGWEALTRQLFNETNGSPAPAYDPNVGKALSEIDISRPIPTMWDYFATLRDKPVMVIRGETSDVLSAATVQEMQARHPGLTSVLIHNEGHVPLLHDRFSQRLIADFLSEADRSWRPEAFAPFRRHEGGATLALRDLTSP
jgi:pimeloyl-ACP methyl ester carboxylesterase